MVTNSDKKNAKKTRLNLYVMIVTLNAVKEVIMNVI